MMATVSRLLATWLADCERLGLSPATVAVYREVSESFFIPALRTKRLDRPSARDLDELYGVLQARKVSPYRVIQAHRAIRAALGKAMRWGWVRTNVAQMAEPPKLPHTEVSTPTPEQVRASWPGSRPRIRTSPTWCSWRR